jgi:hypothetical protein
VGCGEQQSGQQTDDRDAKTPWRPARLDHRVSISWSPSQVS